MVGCHSKGLRWIFCAPTMSFDSEEQWKSLKEAVHGWMAYREWPVANRLALFRRSRNLQSRERLMTSTKALTGLSEGEIALTPPSPGVDCSLEEESSSRLSAERG